MGRWMMKSEELDASTVTFVVGLDGALVFPGQVFSVQDEMRAGLQGCLAGLAAQQQPQSWRTSRLLCRVGPTQLWTCVLNDGTVESKAINTSTSSGTSVAVTSAFSSAPLACQAIYSISTDSVKEQNSVAFLLLKTMVMERLLLSALNLTTFSAAADEDEELEFIDVTTVDSKPPKPII